MVEQAIELSEDIIRRIALATDISELEGKYGMNPDASSKAQLERLRAALQHFEKEKEVLKGYVHDRKVDGQEVTRGMEN